MKEAKVIQEGEMKDAIIDFLITIPLFDKLKADELRIIAKRMGFIEINKGEILFKEGDKGDYVCFIVDGTLDVLKESATEEGVVITALSEGRSIGEMSVIDDFPRSATIKARTEAKLVILTQGNFELILEEHPKIGIKILKRISRLLSLNMRKTSSRLADYMLPLNWTIPASPALRCILLSHRVVGPLYRIELTLDKLIQGEDVEYIHLRKDDELKELAEKINRLIPIVKKSKEIQIKQGTGPRNLSASIRKYSDVSLNNFVIELMDRRT